ncbi:MAG: M20 family metallopeptidase, partial [Thermodesulfobacteriota bacterium]
MTNLTPDKKLITWMRNIRRHLHQHPELPFEEHRTSAYIQKKLGELKIPYRAGLAQTGILATLDGGGNNKSPCVALRADMDALPLEEKTGLSFSSKTPGVMHACGHDGHIAMLLGAAALLKDANIQGQVKLIFQPAEEGGGGAESMIRDGALDGVDIIFGGHIDRHFSVGEIAVQEGIICAYTDEFRIEIKGRGGHAAKPHETVDSIVVASLLVMSIQTLVSREINPSHPSVITVGQINGGSAPNVIADLAILEGTIRTTHPGVRDDIFKGLKRMVKAVGELHQATTSILFTQGYKPIINDPYATSLARKSAELTIGKEMIRELPHPSMGGEDFSYYLDRVPGCFVRFGARKAGLTDAPAHSPRFDFDEAALPVGASFLARS